MQTGCGPTTRVLAGMLLALGIYYFTGGLIPAIIGGVLFFALAVYRPELTIACIALAIPLFYRSRSFEIGARTLYFPPPSLSSSPLSPPG